MAVRIFVLKDKTPIIGADISFEVDGFLFLKKTISKKTDIKGMVYLEINPCKVYLNITGNGICYNKYVFLKDGANIINV